MSFDRDKSLKPSRALLERQGFTLEVGFFFKLDMAQRTLEKSEIRLTNKLKPKNMVPYLFTIFDLFL